MNRDAGRLDRRIKLLRREEVKDPEFGAVKEVFPLLAEVWAVAVPVGGNEQLLDDDQGVTVQERVAFRVRYRPDLQRTQQIEDNRGRRFVITSLREIERNAWVIIDAQERGAA